MLGNIAYYKRSFNIIKKKKQVFLLNFAYYVCDKLKFYKNCEIRIQKFYKNQFHELFLI